MVSSFCVWQSQAAVLSLALLVVPFLFDELPLMLAAPFFAFPGIPYLVLFAFPHIPFWKFPFVAFDALLPVSPPINQNIYFIKTPFNF